jgi:hypothetical protein
MISGQLEFEKELKANKLKQYVNFHESFNDVEKKYPILKNFTKSGFYRSEPINKMLGEEFVNNGIDMTSLLFNILLNKLVKKGYDIYKEDQTTAVLKHKIERIMKLR